MNDNVRKIFEILGIEPNENFKIDNGFNDFYSTFYMTDDLSIFDNNEERRPFFLQKLLNGSYKIIKLPKEPKKLRDLTPEEWNKWRDNNCTSCYKCIFRNVYCDKSRNDTSWVNNKDLYSDKFLDQEIEVEE